MYPHINWYEIFFIKISQQVALLLRFENFWDTLISTYTSCNHTKLYMHEIPDMRDNILSMCAYKQRC